MSIRVHNLLFFLIKLVPYLSSLQSDFYHLPSCHSCQKAGFLPSSSCQMFFTNHIFFQVLNKMGPPLFSKEREIYIRQLKYSDKNSQSDLKKNEEED